MSNSVRQYGKIYCANCLHCKTVSTPSDDENGRVLRVRCAMGQWRKRQGDEKLYKYFTVARRSREACEFYEPMGDSAQFLKDLRDSLPLQDEIYDPQTMQAILD